MEKKKIRMSTETAVLYYNDQVERLT